MMVVFCGMPAAGVIVDAVIVQFCIVVNQVIIITGVRPEDWQALASESRFR